MNPSLRELIRLNLLVAAGYALLGALALRIAIEPGITSPIFPGAGLALACTLLYGHRALAGLYLGTILIQLITGTNPGVSYQPWLVFGIPLGVCLQALLGARLARRLQTYPSALDDFRSVTLFICIVAPISSLISASFATLLFSLSTLDAHADLYNWINWWAGDTLGVLIMTPICLALLAQPASQWEERRRIICLPLLLSALIMASSLMLVRQREEVRVHTEFVRDTEHVSSTLQASLQAKMDILLALERQANLNPMLSASDWQELTRPWLERYPGIINLTWNPRVEQHELESFQARQRNAGYPDYHVMDRDLAGNLVPARVAQEYFPIALIEPLAGNEKVLGLNPAGYPRGAMPIEVARSTGRPAASDPIVLVQGPRKQPGVIVYQPVFAEARNQVSGMITMALRMEDVVSIAREQLGAARVDLCLADRSASPDQQRLAGPEGCAQPGWDETGLARMRQLSFADREWQIILRTQAPYSGSARSWVSSAALFAVLVIAGLLSAFLLMTSGRARRTSETVALRTAELARASTRLRDQQALLAQAQRIARMGSWEITPGNPAVHCSEEFLRLFGLHTDASLESATLLQHLIPEDRPRLEAALNEASLTASSRTLDCRILDPSGVEQILHFHVESEWFMGRLMRIFGTAQNVTESRQAEAHIQHLARFDPLTSLPNRTYWLEQARLALTSARRHGDQAAVLFLDLDHFKTINDSLGHPVGDKLLASVAQRLRQCLRAEDILARQGGDEFVLLLPRLQAIEEITVVATKLVQSLSAPLMIDEHELSVSVSIGIAHFPSDGNDIDTLLKHADVAMYSAKQAGRSNYQFFVPEMNQRAMQRLQLENALRRAIDRGELVLHYQPQLDLASGRIDGCEALVRWQQPEHGMVPPIEFIPLAEESGLILPLGDWVMREACAQQVRWAEEGFPLIMAINIAALQFQQTDFVQRVRRILEETGANPRYIELEITEGALLASTDELLERLEQLRNMGLSLALDDFGTGYSCLAYLKRLPIERLKIDRSFIKDLPGDLEDAAIASATLSMARDLGMSVVAEGVESETQRAWLHERDCRSIQGYLVSKPMHAEDFSLWMSREADAALDTAQGRAGAT